MKARSIFALLILTVTLAFAGCAPAQVEHTPTAAAVTGRITFAGSTTVQPLAAELGKAFNQIYPEITLEIAAGGSGVGIQAVHDGTADIGMASRQLTDEETEGIEHHQIAVDVIAMVVNPSNPINDLTIEKLRHIYSGEITTWSELGGADVAITVAVRETTSGTRMAFDELVLDKADPAAPEMVNLMTAGDVAAFVTNNPNAIGYVGFGNLEEGLKSLKVNGVTPTEDNARDGSYALTRPLLLLTGPLSQPVAETFVEYALSAAGQHVVVDSGWIPAN